MHVPVRQRMPSDATYEPSCKIPDVNRFEVARI